MEPDPEDEAIRDLARAREDAVNGRVQARHQFKGFLLRHDVRYKGKVIALGPLRRLPHGSQGTTRRLEGRRGEPSAQPGTSRTSAAGRMATLNVHMRAATVPPPRGECMRGFSNLGVRHVGLARRRCPYNRRVSFLPGILALGREHLRDDA